jgi:thiol:disulfide interchange protein DsbD
MGRTAVALAAFISAFGAGEAVAQIDSAPKVQARLIAETGEVAPGGSVTVALEENIRPGWHTYWINPGDAGAPTEIKWTLPPGWRAGPIQWPYPKRVPVGPLMDYGYDGRLWLLTKLTAPREAKPGDIVTLKAAASWLVCKEVCVPEDATLSLPLSISAKPAAPYATIEDDFAAARARLPRPAPWPVRFKASGTLDLFAASPTLTAASLKDASFFPLAQGMVHGIAAQKLGFADSGIVLRMMPESKAKSAQHLDGVLVLTSTDGSQRALSIHAARGAIPPARFGGGEVELGLALALFFALVGGVILNLMPCVLPILAMKTLAIANVAHGDRRAASREGLAYGAGAVLSFAALGLAVVLLRASGEAIGWGFQLQEPAAVAGFALLIFAVGLNLSGVFEIGGIGAGDSLRRRGGLTGSLFTGILAVAVAAPCTAPFMAAALGYALAQTASVALLVFITLGVGFVLPFVLIGFGPGLTRRLPRPGPWMLRLKQALAFPMYGAAAWLVWVLAQEAGANGLIAALAAMVVLAFAAWAWSASRNAAPRWRLAGSVLALLALLAALATLPLIHSTAAAPRAAADVSGIPSEPYSQARLNQLREANRPVFINATAAWCITCLVNERVAFSGAAVRDAFARRHVAYLVADWTNRNPEISALLQDNGRSGVPLYLYYPSGGGAPKVLPQVLTQDAILAAIK